MDEQIQAVQRRSAYQRILNALHKAPLDNQQRESMEKELEALRLEMEAAGQL